MNILIDPGHGGLDQGACANGMREASYVLATAHYLKDYLWAAGHVAHLTRAGDHALGPDKKTDLAARCAIEQSWKPDLFLSLHCNAFIETGAHGFEVWTSPGQTRSDLAAECIINAFSKAFPDRVLRRDFADGDQDKEAKFYVLTGTKGPAVLVELGFLTNKNEAIWLNEKQIEIVKALAAGVDLCIGKMALA